MAIYKQRYKWV